MNQHTRFPRTLQEAFGPYTSNRIDEPMPDDDFDQPRSPMTPADIVLLVLVFSTSIALVGTLAGYLWAVFAA